MSNKLTESLASLEETLINLIDTDGYRSSRVERLYSRYSKTRKNQELEMISDGHWYGELMDTCVSPEGYSEND